MVVWAKRRYSPKGHLEDLQTFRERFELRGTPGAMMIETIAAGAPYRDVYVALPDIQSLSLFVGYKRVGDDDLPKDANMLAGDQPEFESRFGKETTADQ